MGLWGKKSPSCNTLVGGPFCGYWLDLEARMDHADPQEGYLVLVNEGVTTLQPQIKFQLIDNKVLRVGERSYGTALYDWADGRWQYRRKSHVKV